MIGQFRYEKSSAIPTCFDINATSTFAEVDRSDRSSQMLARRKRYAQRIIAC